MSGENFQDPMAHLQSEADALFQKLQNKFGEEYVNSAKRNSKKCLVCHVKSEMVTAMTFFDNHVKKNFIIVFGMCRQCEETTEKKSLMQYVLRKYPREGQWNQDNM